LYNNKKENNNYNSNKYKNVKFFENHQAQFFDNINKSWKNFNIPQRYSETYNTINKKIQYYTSNATNFINEITVGGCIENFNRLVELTQRYYNDVDVVQNNFNYARRIERSYKRQ
jgi:nitrate/nitrite-specific signal transduction histidine kinase